MHKLLSKIYFIMSVWSLVTINITSHGLLQHFIYEFTNVHFLMYITYLRGFKF